MQLMSIFIIVIDMMLNSERLLVVLSLLLQSLSNDSYCLNILWFILARFIRKCLMQNLFMGCKARMYLHRPLAALSNKSIRQSILKSNWDFLCLLWIIRARKQREILNQTRYTDRFYYNKAIWTLLIVHFRSLFLHGEALWLSELCKSQYCFSVSDDNDVCYTSVSGFVFLRFFAPAILNPKLFQMRNEHAVSNIWPFLKDWNK